MKPSQDEASMNVATDVNGLTNPQPTPDRGTPPPIPQRPPRYRKPGEKLLLIAMLSLLMTLGALCVLGMTESRQDTANEAYEEIRGTRLRTWNSKYGSDRQESGPDMAAGWGGPVLLTGPIAIANDTTGRCLLPQLYNCNVEVQTHRVHRGQYECELFESPVKISGTFDGAALRALGRKATIRVKLDLHNLTKLDSLSIGGMRAKWQSDNQGLYAHISTDWLPDSVTFTTSFTIRGSESLNVARLGEGSHISIRGEASSPSFDTAWLPVNREVTETGFSARWEGPIAIGATKVSELVNLECASVHFLTGVNNYQKVERMLKYAILIIALTFLSVWVIEIVCRNPIPLLNYFLIGAALVVCYALLLSISEHTGFGIAYLISTAMTVGLIVTYMWLMLASRKVAGVTAAFLTLLYAVCYIMLCAETYALLMGTLLLFIAVAAAMYGTLRLRRNNAS